MVRKRHVGPWLLLFFLLSASPAAATERGAEFEAFYARLSIAAPAVSRVTVCYGFECRGRAVIEFSRADRGALTRIMARGRASPNAERQAVARAVGWFDRRVGPQLGTKLRIARADAFTSNKDHNFDCIDTSTNTTSLLLMLADWGLLRHHTVGLTAYRGNLLIGQTPHNTAVLIENKGRREWSVDMWTTNYGDQAEVMPIEQWLQAN